LFSSRSHLLASSVLIPSGCVFFSLLQLYGTPSTENALFSRPVDTPLEENPRGLSFFWWPFFFSLALEVTSGEKDFSAVGAGPFLPPRRDTFSSLLFPAVYPPGFFPTEDFTVDFFFALASYTFLGAVHRPSPYDTILPARLALRLKESSPPCEQSPFFDRDALFPFISFYLSYLFSLDFFLPHLYDRGHFYPVRQDPLLAFTMREGRSDARLLPIT